MAQHTQPPSPSKGRLLLSSLVTLAFWQLRHTWRMLIFTGIGMLAAVLLTCSAPLYAQVAETAGVRGVLTASPENSTLTLETSPGKLRLAAQQWRSGDITEGTRRAQQWAAAISAGQ